MTAVARPHAPAPAFSEPLRRALAQGLVLLDAEVAGRLEPVVDWLVAWDEALLADWGVPSGTGLQGLYGRAVAFSGAGPLWRHRESAVRELARLTARGVGVSVEAPVPSGRADAEQADVLGYLEAIGPSSVVVRLTDGGDTVDPVRDDALCRIVPALAAHHSLVLVGDPARWAGLGVLARPEVSAAQVSVVPSDTGGRALSAAGLIAGRHGLDSPCVTRFRAVVAPDGHVYPCLGLVGHPGARLGTLGEPVRRVDPGLASALETWGVEGPWRCGTLDAPLAGLDAPAGDADPLGDIARLVADGLPPVCAAHAASFLAPD